MALQDPPRRPGSQIDHDQSRIRATRRVADENAPVDRIDGEIVDELVLRGDRRRQVNDPVQPIRLGIPAHQFGCDAAAHPIVQHPHDAIRRRADAQHRIEFDFR